MERAWFVEVRGGHAEQMTTVRKKKHGEGLNMFVG